MKSYNKRYISRADFHALQSLRIPYTGFVKGIGYAYTSYGFIPPAHQHRVSAPTDPNGSTPMDATPFRAHKTYILSDALSWISLVGSMARPRANNRSTNFWAWFGQCLEKLGDMGSAMAPREAYGEESEKTPTHIAEKEYGIGAYSTWIKESPNMFYDLTRDSVLLIRPTGDSVLYVGATQNPHGVRYKVPTNFKNTSK